jgi:hypothetical protein
MLDRRPQLGSETGQTAAEAMGVLLLVSLIIAALVISAAASDHRPHRRADLQDRAAVASSRSARSTASRRRTCA